MASHPPTSPTPTHPSKPPTPAFFHSSTPGAAGQRSQPRGSGTGSGERVDGRVLLPSPTASSGFRVVQSTGEVGVAPSITHQVSERLLQRRNRVGWGTAQGYFDADGVSQFSAHHVFELLPPPDHMRIQGISLDLDTLGASGGEEDGPLDGAGAEQPMHSYEIPSSSAELRTSAGIALPLLPGNADELRV